MEKFNQDKERKKLKYLLLKNEEFRAFMNEHEQMISESLDKMSFDLNVVRSRVRKNFNSQANDADDASLIRKQVDLKQEYLDWIGKMLRVETDPKKLVA